MIENGKIFSSEKQQNIELYQEILYILSTISERTIESTYSLLISLNFLSKDSFYQFIIKKIILFCDIYPLHIDLYIQLSKKLSIIIPNFLKNFIEMSFHRYYFYINCVEASFVLYMLYCCLKEELFNFQDLLNYYKSIFRQKYQFQDDNILFFAYFSPEIKENDIEFYQEIEHYTINIIESSSQITSSALRFYLGEYQKNFIQNDFYLLKKIRKEAHISENPLFEIIYHDDVDQLRDFLSNPNNSSNEIITHSVISPYKEIAYNLSLISTAAFTSSVKCFKYLLMNGSKIDNVSTKAGSLAQDTIVGGNIEIIRFAQQNRVNFEGTLTTCANYFRNDIFDWIFEMKGNNITELTKLSPTGSTVFCQACSIGNIEIVLKCIEMGVDLNSKDLDSLPIMQAVIGGCDEIVDLLISYGNESKPNSIPSNTNEGPVIIHADNSDDEYEEEEYEYDYDNFNFEDKIFSSFYKIKPFLEINEKINLTDIYHAMKYASEEGQNDCLKIFLDYGLVVDISLINRAIIYSRYSTLSFLFDKVDFQNRDEYIIMTTHSNSAVAKKDFQIIFNRKFLIIHIIKLLIKQNDVNVVNLTLNKLHFDINDDSHKILLNDLLNQYYDIFGKILMVDSFGFFLIHLRDEDKIRFMQNVPEKKLLRFLRTTIYKDKFIVFLSNYKNTNDIHALPNKTQKLFEIFTA